MKKTVTVVEDDHRLRRQILEILKGIPDIECVGAYPSAEEALVGIPEKRPDVVLMDIKLPKMSGIQCVAELKKVLPTLQVIMVTVYEDSERIFKALKAGASGYVLKDAAAPELVGAIRAAKRGDTYLSPGVSRLVVRKESGKGTKELKTVSQHLTNREREVCKLLAEGHTVPAIAGMIGISRKTVDVHKTRLMKKLDIHNRAELVKYSITNKLIEL